LDLNLSPAKARLLVIKPITKINIIFFIITNL